MQRVSAGALDSRTHGFAPDESTGETAVLVSRSAAQHDARRLTDRARFREGRLHRWRARHGSRLTGAPPHKRRRATGEGDSMRLHDGQFAGRTLHDPKPRLQHRRKRVDDVPRFAELHRERTVGIVNGPQWTAQNPPLIDSSNPTISTGDRDSWSFTSWPPPCASRCGPWCASCEART
jgi:hypothetical protein